MSKEMAKAGPITNLSARDLGGLRITKKDRSVADSCTYCGDPCNHIFEVDGGNLRYRMCEKHLREFVRQANELLKP